MRPIRHLAAMVFTAALGLNVAVAHADDHERARRAFEAGRIVPLSAVLDRLDPQADGEVLEVELEDDDEAFVYEIKLLAPDGRIMERRFDAHTGEPLGAAREDD